MHTALDRFFEHYYRRRPVTATFTGVHNFDRLLPDWSPDGLAAMDDEMRTLRADLSRMATPTSALESDAEIEALDARLAGDYLAMQLAENAGRHGPAGNPSLWTGEAFLGVAGLMMHDFASFPERMSCAAARLEAIPAFFAHARRALGARQIPEAWVAKALRECEGGKILCSRGIERWTARASSVPARLMDAARKACGAIEDFASWLREREAGSDASVVCDPDLYQLFLARGHYCSRSPDELLREAHNAMAVERSRLDEMSRAIAGSWPEAQAKIAAAHPDPSAYLPSFGRVWREARDVALQHDVVSWPDWPIRYVSYPPGIEDSAPYLYYLHYRSPAPFDLYDVHDYVVPRLVAGREQDALRVWNNSVIKLNHVVHHGGIGHHVQNWHAYHRARSRVGRIAAVDCANRIGMFCGGTMAEGWASYVPRLMDELGYLDPLDQIAEQHTRVRALARTIVDLEIHHGRMSLQQGAEFYVERAGMGPDAARGEVVRNSMYPCAALMYWLGTSGILECRDKVRPARGGAWSLKQFHDELLGHGSIPIPLIAESMAARSRHPVPA